MIPELVSTPGMDFLKVKDVYSPGSHIGLGWNTVNYGWGWRRLTKSTCTHTYSYLRVRVCACVRHAFVQYVRHQRSLPVISRHVPGKLQLSSQQYSHSTFSDMRDFSKKKKKIIHATFCLIWKKKVSHLLCVTSEPQRHEINSYGWWKVKDTLDFHQIREWAATLCKIKSTFLILSFHGSPQLNI